MQKQTTTTTLICDCCGKEVGWFSRTSESCYRSIESIKLDVWYGGERSIEDLCSECNEKIIRFLDENKMLENLRKKEDK